MAFVNTGSHFTNRNQRKKAHHQQQHTSATTSLHGTWPHHTTSHLALFSFFSFLYIPLFRSLVVVHFSIVITNYKLPFTTYFLTHFERKNHLTSSFAQITCLFSLGVVFFFFGRNLLSNQSQTFHRNSNMQQMIIVDSGSFDLRRGLIFQKNDTSCENINFQHRDTTRFIHTIEMDNFFYYQFLSNVDNLFTFFCLSILSYQNHVLNVKCDAYRHR